MDANLDSNEKRAIFWLFLEAKYKLQVPTKPMKTLMEAFGFDYIWQAYTYFTELEKIQKEHEYNAGPTAAPFLIKLTSSLFTYEQVRMWTDAFYECARDVLITELRDYTKVSYEHYLITETCITVEQYWKSVHGLSVKNAVNSSSSRNVSLGSHWTRNFAEIHHMSIPLKTKLIRVGMSTCAKKLSCYRNESVHRGQTASWFTPANVIEALIESVSELWDAPVAAFKAIVTIVIDNRRIKLNACPQRKVLCSVRLIVFTARVRTSRAEFLRPLRLSKKSKHNRLPLISSLFRCDREKRSFWISPRGMLIQGRKEPDLSTTFPDIAGHKSNSGKLVIEWQKTRDWYIGDIMSENIVESMDAGAFNAVHGQMLLGFLEDYMLNFVNRTIPLEYVPQNMLSSDQLVHEDY